MSSLDKEYNNKKYITMGILLHGDRDIEYAFDDLKDIGCILQAVSENKSFLSAKSTVYNFLVPKDQISKFEEFREDTIMSYDN